MNSGYTELAENIINIIKSNHSVNPVTLIRGSFGIGKSELVHEIVSHFNEGQFFDCIVNTNFGVEKKYIGNYLKTAEIQFPKLDAGSFNSDLDETLYNDSRLNELLNIFSEKDIESAQIIKRYLQLKLFPDADESYPSNIDKFDSKIETLIEKKSDRKLLMQNSRVTAESLIVDLMNMFFPNSEKYSSYDKYLESITSPVKILFVFDNFDKIAFSIFQWLSEYFLPLCLYAKLGDLIAYQVQESEKELTINGFFDFHFIISNRIDPTVNSFFPFLEAHPEILYKVELKEWSVGESRQYLQNNNDSIALNHDGIITASFGNRFLMDMFSYINHEVITDEIKKSVYNKIIYKYLDSKSPLQIDIIKFTSFVDDITIEDIRSIPDLFDTYDYAWKFLLFLNDLTDYQDNKLYFKHPYKIILKSIQDDRLEIIKSQTKNMRSIMASINEIMPGLKDEELKIVRSLAYFENFDYDTAIENAFLDKAENAKIFIQNHNNLFFKHIHTYTLKNDIRDVLMKLNHIIDKNKIEAKNQLINSIWSDKKIELENEKSNLKSNLENLKNEAELVIDDPGKIKSYYEDQQRKFIKAENDLIQLRKSLGDFSIHRFVLNFIINITATVISFLTSYFFPDIFSTPENHSSIIIIQYILYLISLVFGFLAIHNSYKIFKIRMQKDKVAEIQEKINILETEKQGFQDEMKHFKDNKSTCVKRSQEVNELIKTAKIRIDLIDSILNEPYII